MREYINNIDCTGTSVTLALAGGRGIDLTKMKNAFQSALKKEPKAIFETNETLFKTIRFNDELIEDFEDFSNFVKSTEFTESDLASILKVTE